MSAPYEIVAQPFTLWVAPTGTTFPALEESPTGSWTKVGSSGDLNYSEDGVVVSHPQSVEVFRALGSTGPRKAFRTEEELRISLSLADLTLEQYALAMNYNTVTTVAAGVGTAGYKKIGLSRGLDVLQRALLVRGAGSPYGTGTAADWYVQFQVPIAVQVGEPEINFTKGEAAMIALEFMALEDPDATDEEQRFGLLLAQNADIGT